ncbi:multi-copy leucine-rich repeat protein, putative [Bodo saltans]|uniref:Multi-copy leucine-rich repeat protein, putative n=1 Tax=Bodo saltans TaxID=75058 RepID=A0A0S4IQ40_BODSA|nr:multi-copy leucine-rich repeat protein, putative [Bodo saltans]|eukprot:CUF17338.1 multi-copy leucine-rich repeat protein, putative [Bodo saltans]
MRRMRCCVPTQRIGLPTMCAGAFRFQSSNDSPSGSQQRTSLLCNSGCTGVGKTTLLHHTIVEALRVLELMVGEHVEAAGGMCKSVMARGEKDETDAKKYLQRPLGFYVTFSGDDTPSSADQKYLYTQSGSFPILTAIALRMAYSVVPSDNRESYQDFTARVAPHCDRISDGGNFMSIVKALRSELGWEGPMFLAIDEFRKPYENRTSDKRRAGLSRMHAFLLDGALPLATSPSLNHIVYSSYLAVAMEDAVDFVDLSTSSRFKLIAQAMPIISVRDEMSCMTCAW